MKKRIFLAMAALVMTTVAFAQEYMVIENPFGGYSSIDISNIQQAYFTEYTASGTGVEANPFNVAAANAKCKEVGTEPSTEQFYVKGLVVSIGQNNTGKAAYIADDEKGINRLYVYKLSVPDNVELKRGDEVVIYGSLYNYRNVTPEMEGEVVAVNGQPVSGGVEPITPGTLENPLTPSQAYNAVATLNAGVVSGVDFFVKGKICSIKYFFSQQYGTALFDISDDGNTGNKQFKVYSCYFLGNQPWVDGNTQIQIGDEVLVCGKVINYMGTTPEFAEKKSYIVSLNGKTSETVSGEGGEGGGDVEAAGDGSLANPFNVAAAIAKCQEVGETTSTEKYYIKGIVVAAATPAANYGNATFDIVDVAGSTKMFKCYQTLGSDGKKMPTTYTIPAGAEVLIYGPVVNYRGNTPETAGKGAAYIVTVNGQPTEVVAE